MPLAPALERLFDTLRRRAVCGLRALLVVSMVVFAAQPAGALTTHHTMKSPGAGIAIWDASAAQAKAIEARDAECCQPAEEQPACPDCAAVSCAAASATLAAMAGIRIFPRSLRHVFFDPAFALSPHGLPPELEPPRA